MPTYRVKVDLSGPVFDGKAQAAAQAMRHDILGDIADEGVRMLRAFPMDKTGRAHGNFQSHLKVVARSADTLSIPGPMIKGVTWAPWLEGTSKRNARTRFKGYHLFRLTAQELRRRAQVIAQKRVAEFVRLMGGS